MTRYPPWQGCWVAGRPFLRIPVRGRSCAVRGHRGWRSPSLHADPRRQLRPAWANVEVMSDSSRVTRSVVPRRAPRAPDRPSSTAPARGLAAVLTSSSCSSCKMTNLHGHRGPSAARCGPTADRPLLTVASVIAVGSTSLAVNACCSHARNCRNGSGSGVRFRQARQLVVLAKASRGERRDVLIARPNPGPVHVRPTSETKRRRQGDVALPPLAIGRVVDFANCFAIRVPPPVFCRRTSTVEYHRGTRTVCPRSFSRSLLCCVFQRSQDRSLDAAFNIPRGVSRFLAYPTTCCVRYVP